MAPERLETQVIVVGAGPVGLLLAGELRLGGADVVVLEQRRSPTRESRASTLHARTMELLDSRGLLAHLGSPPNDPRGHFGGIPLDLTLPGPYPGQWKVPQTRTEALLEEWALSLGADIRCGHRLRSLTVVGAEGAEGEYVEVEAEGREGVLRLRGRYLVACDGEDSTVRRLTGAPFPGRGAQRELLRADVAGISVPDRRFERLEQGLAIAAHRDGVTRVMVHEFAAALGPRTTEPDFAQVVDVWKRVTGEDISAGAPLWVNSFGDANQQLSQYRHGPVLFAGDAAHRQMPVGGQALNLGLQDAFNLGWKLALHLRGGTDGRLLDSYHDERHAVGRRVLSNIETQTSLLLGGPEVEPLRALLRELMVHREVREHLAGMISGLDVRYLVEGPAHPLLGLRLPPAPLRTAEGEVGTAELLRDGRGLLLEPDRGPVPDSGSAPEPDSGPDGWAHRVDRVTGRPEPGHGLDGAGSLLVRPDGHIAWAGTDRTGLPEALRRWFGPPR